MAHGVRIVLQHLPNLYGIMPGAVLDKPEDAPPELAMNHDGTMKVYYRVRSTERWVLYRRAMTGYGRLNEEGPQIVFDPFQR